MMNFSNLSTHIHTQRLKKKYEKNIKQAFIEKYTLFSIE